MRKLILSLVLALGLLFALVMPVFAITNPNTLQINAVWVYRNCIETFDQLYLVDYTCNYTAPLPAETITEAYLVRLMDGTTELGSTAPYAYHDKGYNRGVVAIYFSADEAPAWEGSYTLILMGNPMLSWSGDPPSTSIDSFDVWHDWAIAATQVILSDKILWLAEQLEAAWSTDGAVDLIETTAWTSRLTSYGEAYFANVIPNLRTMAPYAFLGQSTQPEVEKKEFTQSYTENLTASIIGTPLDLTGLADALGISRAMATAILYYAVVILFIVILVNRLGSYKPAMLMSLPLVIGGAFLGVPLVISILVGFFSLVMIGFTLFYRPASA